MPMEASAFPWLALVVSLALVMSSNRVDFPLEEKPMRAALSMANRESYLRNSCCHVATAFQVVRLNNRTKDEITCRKLLNRCLLPLTLLERSPSISVEFFGQKWSNPACFGATRRLELTKKGA